MSHWGLIKWRRAGIGATIGCLLMLGAWQTAAVQRIETYGTDSSYYQVLAHNLATHRGYVFDFKPHTLYPPGFPAILALSSPIVGDGYHSFILLMPLFGTIGLIATFLLLDREENWMFGAAACLWLATSPQLFRSATQDVLSDLPYFAVSAAALAAAPSVVLLPVLVAGAVLIRSAGVTLVAAAVATLATTRVRNPIEWLRRRETRALPGAIMAGTAAELLWLRWAIPRVAAPQWPGDAVESYARQMLLKDPHQPSLGLAGLTDLAWRIRDGAAVQMAHFAELITRVGWLDRNWFSPLIVLPFLLMVVGAVVSLAQGRSKFLVWYVAAYFALYSLWPFDEGPRFMLPAFPLLLLLLWRGIEAVRRQAAGFEGSPYKFLVPAALALLGLAALWSFRSLPVRGTQAAASVGFWFAAALFSLPIAFRKSQASGASAGRPRLQAIDLARGRTVAAGLLIFTIGIAGGLFIQGRIRTANRHPAPTKFDSVGTLDVAQWLRSQPPADVVMAQQAAIFHRLTGRRVVMFPLAPDGRLVERAIREYGVSYLVVTEASKYDYFRPSEPERFEALAAADPDCCRLVHVDGDYRVYAIAK